jgi:hypothetical protein
VLGDQLHGDHRRAEKLPRFLLLGDGAVDLLLREQLRFDQQFAQTLVTRGHGKGSVGCVGTIRRGYRPADGGD